MELDYYKVGASLLLRENANDVVCSTMSFLRELHDLLPLIPGPQNAYILFTTTVGLLGVRCGSSNVRLSGDGRYNS